MWWGRLHDFNVKTATEGHYFPRFFRGDITQLCSDHANCGDGWLARFTCAYESGTQWLLGVLILHRNWQEWGPWLSEVEFNFLKRWYTDNEVSFENWNFSEIVYFNFLILKKKKKKKKKKKNLKTELPVKLRQEARPNEIYELYKANYKNICIYIYISRIRLIYTLKKYINYLF